MGKRVKDLLEEYPDKSFFFAFGAGRFEYQEKCLYVYGYIFLLLDNTTFLSDSTKTWDEEPKRSPKKKTGAVKEIYLSTKVHTGSFLHVQDKPPSFESGSRTELWSYEMKRANNCPGMHKYYSSTDAWHVHIFTHTFAFFLEER